MCPLVEGADSLPQKEDRMLKIKASIIGRKGRKYWYVRYQVIFNTDKVKLVEVSTKVGRKEKSLDYMQEVYLPAWIERKKEELLTARSHSTKFEYYAKMFLEDYRVNRDYYNMEKRVTRILEQFGGEDIASIKKLQLKRWINNLVHRQTGKALSKATRKKYKSAIKAVFDYALDDEVIDRNFIGDIKVTGADRNKDDVKPFSLKEVRRLLEASKDKQYGELMHSYLGLVFNQGLSPSEAIGLQVGDIVSDSTNNRILLRIRRGIVKGKEDATKNEYRSRDIILRDEALPFVGQLMEMAKKKRSLWLFSNADGTKLKDISDIRGIREHTNKTTGKVEHRRTKWYKLLYDCNIEHRHIKNCRHTFTMAMLDSGEYSHTALADMLGHSDLQMVIRHYANSIKGKALEIKSDGNLYSSSDTLSDTCQKIVDNNSLKIV